MPSEEPTELEEEDVFFFLQELTSPSPSPAHTKPHWIARVW